MTLSFECACECVRACVRGWCSHQTVTFRLSDQSYRQKKEGDGFDAGRHQGVYIRIWHTFCLWKYLGMRSLIAHISCPSFLADSSLHLMHAPVAHLPFSQFFASDSHTVCASLLLALHVMIVQRLADACFDMSLRVSMSAMYPSNDILIDIYQCTRLSVDTFFNTHII